MRQVGKDTIARVIRALDELGEVTALGATEALAAAKKVQALVIEGHTAEAETFGLREQARLKVLHISAGAKFGAAAVEVLGDRRRADEDLLTYAGRISHAAGDLSRVLEMQRRNGLEMKT